MRLLWGTVIVLAASITAAAGLEGDAPRRAGRPLPAGVLVAQASSLNNGLDAALSGIPAPIAFATRVELIDARLRTAEALLGDNDWGGAAVQAQEAATFAAAITAPQRLRADLASLAADLALIPERLDARAEDATAHLDGARSKLDALRAAALSVGGDIPLNQLRTIEVLLQVMAGVYGQAVGFDGAVRDAGALAFARAILLAGDDLYRPAQPDLESRLQGATYVLTDTMDTLLRLASPAAGPPLPAPQIIIDGVELFLSYASYL
jgi:hypothetical protein